MVSVKRDGEGCGPLKCISDSMRVSVVSIEREEGGDGLIKCISDSMGYLWCLLLSCLSLLFASAC